MRKLIVVVLMALTNACTYDYTTRLTLESGIYKGYFSRSSPLAKFQTSEVTISFDGSRFEGSSSTSKYPAICKGTYSLNGNQIEFTNVCAWTAEFDWSLILSGKYTFSINGDEIQLKRSYDEFNHDSYWLRKQR